MEKNYWKDCCLLLIGVILGSFYQKYLGSIPVIHETSIVRKDTVIKHDTIYAHNNKKFVLEKLSKESVLAELNRQKIPHAEIVLKQARLESGNFTSKLTKTHNNILGIRKNGSYKKYNNYKDCISDYKRLVSSRYKGGDYYNFLLDIGYAEDNLYIQKLKDLV